MRRVILLLSPVVALFLGVFVGSYQTNPIHLNPLVKAVIWEIRLPRTLMAVSAGIALSLSGMSLQAVFRNPLVDTYILGVASGVAFGAALAVSFLPALMTPLALIFGLLAVFMALSIARVNGRVSTVSLILGGIIITALFSALLSLLELLLLARALMTSPRYLLLDEPTSELDLKNSLLVMQTVKRLTREGVGVLAVLHDPNLAYPFADRVALMGGGKIIAVGKPDDVLDEELLSEVYGIELKLIECNGERFLRGVIG